LDWRLHGEMDCLSQAIVSKARMMTAKVVRKTGVEKVGTGLFGEGVQVLLIQDHRKMSKVAPVCN
jgi:hypothetical protein